MGETTGISWASATLNFWIGCTEVSNGEKGACTFCYARTWGARFGVAWGAGEPRRKTVDPLAKAKAIERKGKRLGERQFVFSNSLSDILDNEVPIEWLAEALTVIAATPHSIYLLLTKRAPLILKRLREALAVAGLKELPSNIAFGITVVTQPEADRDIPHLLVAAAHLRPLFTFLSMEPLRSGVDIAWALSRNPVEIAAGILRRGLFSPGLELIRRIGWVITGGESGSNARPTRPDWIRSIRDQCAAAGVSYHHKQNGEWLGVEELRRMPGGQGPGFGAFDHCPHDMESETVRVGKKAAGRLLDGALHDAMPHVGPAPQQDQP